MEDEPDVPVVWHYGRVRLWALSSTLIAGASGLLGFKGGSVIFGQIGHTRPIAIVVIVFAVVAFLVALVCAIGVVIRHFGPRGRYVFFLTGIAIFAGFTLGALLGLK